MQQRAGSNDQRPISRYATWKVYIHPQDIADLLSIAIAEDVIERKLVALACKGLFYT